ncbi:hypothetical protein AMK59_1636 [Oryctes borbonicus]|uniref:Uncharacterized protein n=1 Tax=Oryctes borbonicus TaxID=1629725 RepID=A0A0T6BE42_9SCAR|nr:hypothetical protein AMK59_1636 [Oryctes borbonicus]
MKTVIFLFSVIIKCVHVACVNGAAGYQDEVNMISEDDRRAASSQKSEEDLHTSSSSHLKSNFYLSPTYDSSEYSHSSGNPSYHYQPPTYYSHVGPYGYDQYDHGVSDHRGEHHHAPSQPSHGSGDSKGGLFSALALKGILIPLAGIALLGAAAALSTNPVLLQLGVLNGRRKRSLQADNIFPVNSNLKPTER